MIGLGLGVCFGGNAVGGYSTAALFAGGEQGVWYDPSDLSTLFQDDAGTTPVTTDGQDVALMLDKSGRGNHATQTVAAKRPVYRAAGGLSWLEFSVDNTMQTPTITPGADKLQAFVGLYKTNSTAEIVLEASPNSASNTGSFYLVAGEQGGSKYDFLSGGTGGASAGTRIAKITAASTYPETLVLSATSDIATDTTTIRKNGVNGTGSSGDLGTGNFLAHSINIGSRLQITTFLNGRMYGIVVRFGSNLSAGEISDTEAYIAGKTGVTL